MILHNIFLVRTCAVVKDIQSLYINSSAIILLLDLPEPQVIIRYSIELVGKKVIREAMV